MVGSLVWGRQTIRYEVRFLASRRTLAIEVHPDSRVLVRAPAGCSGQLIAERVQKRAGWISRQLAEFDGYRPRTPERQYVNGESHRYLGRQYRLKVVSGGRPAVALSRGELRVTGAASPAQVKALLHRWFLARASAVFAEVLCSCLPRLPGLQQPRLIVRTMQSRWGSLSRAGTMTLNLRLLGAPRACIEYVVIHELCHARHRDHDARFYRLLAQTLPDWERRKRRLESALL